MARNIAKKAVNKSEAIKRNMPRISQIEGVSFDFREDGASFIVKYKGNSLFRIDPADGVYVMALFLYDCEYIHEVYRKTNRICSWKGTLGELEKHILKLLDEIKVYEISSIKAENTNKIVKELSDIHEAIGTSGNSTANAVSELSDGKPVVRILYDDSKRKYRAYAEWKGKGMWCKFPSKLRVERACYVVDDLAEHNGCWGVVGEIRPLGE